MGVKVQGVYEAYHWQASELGYDQQYSWSPSQYFDEDSYSPPPRNMKGLSGGRPAQLQLTSPTSAHTCGLAECDHSLDHHLHHGDSRPPPPTSSAPLRAAPLRVTTAVPRGALSTLSVW
ncbi:disks large-associated protein 2 [Lates japonicus]|uniref:Disks large-associated protein 2 n=1 Tax=Lates japonicus TaxID=270547 RepID=A0AAD3M1B5_LATJO|nr:disks large-associated protein 2 [Lates japonicus]